MAELKKIELRKKEREKKTQDLQKLITAADTNMEARRSDRKATKKKVMTTQKASLGGAVSNLPAPTHGYYLHAFTLFINRKLVKFLCCISKGEYEMLCPSSFRDCIYGSYT